MDRRGSRLSRRQFVGAGATGLGLLAGCGRLPWQAPARVARVGVLSGEIPTASSSALTEALRQGLGELGYLDGHNVTLEPRFADGQEDRFSELAAELVHLPVDVIVAFGSPLVLAARQATETIPIVMASGGDPVGLGFVDGLARPGGNVTGLSGMSIQLTSKRLELLTAVRPGISRVGVLGQPASAREFREAEAAARQLGVHLLLLEVDGPSDLSTAFETGTREGIEALLIVPGHVTVVYSTLIVELATARQLPTIFHRREFAAVGGLMAYGPNSHDLSRRAAYYVDRILKGAKPADLPVEQPMRFDFVVNLKTAQALGITFPNEIMLQITEVIQ
jgi:putative ABC transport system substrate-binding protein